ncbi:hypothetical protein Bbelb_282610 [Branchiostoma belcheri]|nr:hypothetical protein Bbelb_282610 [Branchiostoma belcheri]
MDEHHGLQVEQYKFRCKVCGKYMQYTGMISKNVQEGLKQSKKDQLCAERIGYGENQPRQAYKDMTADGKAPRGGESNARDVKTLTINFGRLKEAANVAYFINMYLATGMYLGYTVLILWAGTTPQKEVGDVQSRRLSFSDSKKNEQIRESIVVEDGYYVGQVYRVDVVDLATTTWPSCRCAEVGKVTRPVEQIRQLINQLLDDMWELTDTSGVRLISPKSIKTVWAVQQKHLYVDPDGVNLYTITGQLEKGGNLLKVLRCARGSSSVESFHRHQCAFIPGWRANAAHTQMYMMGGGAGGISTGQGRRYNGLPRPRPDRMTDRDPVFLHHSTTGELLRRPEEIFNSPIELRADSKKDPTDCEILMSLFTPGDGGHFFCHFPYCSMTPGPKLQKFLDDVGPWPARMYMDVALTRGERDDEAIRIVKDTLIDDFNSFLTVRFGNIEGAGIFKAAETLFNHTSLPDLDDLSENQELCDFCINHEYTLPTPSPIPRPYPDYDTITHTTAALVSDDLPDESENEDVSSLDLGPGSLEKCWEITVQRLLRESKRTQRVCTEKTIASFADLLDGGVIFFGEWRVMPQRDDFAAEGVLPRREGLQRRLENDVFPADVTSVWAQIWSDTLTGMTNIEEKRTDMSPHLPTLIDHWNQGMTQLSRGQAFEGQSC